ncbi:MAG TPA: hypothetical protein VIM07_10935 [Chitinophagaceae bacterium]
MKFKTVLSFLIAFYSLTGHSQTNDPTLLLDTSLAKKITVSGFCLCQTSLSDLKKLANDFKPVDVEEMDSPKNCFGQDGRYENGKGYYSNKFPGIIFQKDQSTDCKLPQKQYVLKVDKISNFKNVKHEKEHIQSCPDCRHSQRV